VEKPRAEAVNVGGSAPREREKEKRLVRKRGQICKKLNQTNPSPDTLGRVGLGRPSRFVAGKRKIRQQGPPKGKEAGRKECGVVKLIETSPSNFKKT